MLTGWRTIRAKLLILVLAAVAAAGLLIAALTSYQEAERYALGKREMLAASAEIIAASAARGLAADDGLAIHGALRAIGRIPSLSYAVVHSTDGRVLAEAGATEMLSSDLIVGPDSPAISLLALLSSGSLEYRAPIILGGETVGSLSLISSISDLPAHVGAAIQRTLLASFVAVGAALLLVQRMHRSIVGPLQGLAKVIAQVSQDHRYDVAISAQSNDEVGVLIAGFRKMLRDIHERDQRLFHHRQTLELAVAERTKELAAAKEIAEEATHQKSTFLATMSHEIRTPMNGLLVMAELLSTSELPAKAERYAKIISASGRNLLAIINDILDVSKIEAGKLELESVPVFLEDLVDTTLHLFWERAAEKGLDLAAWIDPAVPKELRGDPTRLSQVLSNLVNNAIKFTATGGVLMRIGQHPQRLDLIQFEIEDTGIGIAPDKIDHIFSAFSQAEQSTARQFGGTGLGLTICKRLVEAMGSTIEVRSVVGSGSTFCFSLKTEDCPFKSLPRARPQLGKAAVCELGHFTGQVVQRFLQVSGYQCEMITPEQLRVSPAKWEVVVAGRRCIEQTALTKRVGRLIAAVGPGEPPIDALIANGVIDGSLSLPVSSAQLPNIFDGPIVQPATPPARRLYHEAALPAYYEARILVADDNAINREIAAEALHRFGIRPEFAEDGKAALSRCSAVSFDLVLMDGNMPEMSGYEATLRLREIEQADGRRRTAVVALTADVVGSHADDWKKAAMDDVLTKPFTLKQLEAILGRFLGPDHRQQDTQPLAAVCEDSSGVLNEEVLRQLQNSPAVGFFERVVRLYDAHGPRLISELRTAQASASLGSFSKAAHALKSMSLNIGAQEAARKADHLEHLSGECKDLPAIELIDELEVAVSGARRCLEEALTRRGATK